MRNDEDIVYKDVKHNIQDESSKHGQVHVLHEESKTY